MRRVLKAARSASVVCVVRSGEEGLLGDSGCGIERSGDWYD